MAVGLSVVKGPYGAFLDALQQARKSVNTFLFLRTEK
jgi:hypothetical protein